MKTILPLLFLFAFSGCKSDNQFVIKGTINGDFDNNWIYLTEFYADEPVYDSIIVKNGKFTFRGSIDYPEAFILNNFSESDFKHFDFFLEPVKMSVEINPDDWTYGSRISGGPINDEYNRAFRGDEVEFVKLNREITDRMLVADSAEKIELEKTIMESQDQHLQRDMEYITTHPDSPVSPYLLSRVFFAIPFDESQKILDNMSDENKQTSICLFLQDRLDMMKEFNNGSLESE